MEDALRLPRAAARVEEEPGARRTQTTSVDPWRRSSDAPALHAGSAHTDFECRSLLRRESAPREHARRDKGASASTHSTGQDLEQHGERVRLRSCRICRAHIDAMYVQCIKYFKALFETLERAGRGIIDLISYVLVYSTCIC